MVHFEAFLLSEFELLCWCWFFWHREFFYCNWSFFCQIQNRLCDYLCFLSSLVVLKASNWTCPQRLSILLFRNQFVISFPCAICCKNFLMPLSWLLALPLLILQFLRIIKVVLSWLMLLICILKPITLPWNIIISGLMLKMEIFSFVGFTPSINSLTLLPSHLLLLHSFLCVNLF